MSLDTLPGRFAYTGDHEAFRQTVRSFLAKEGVPDVEAWEKDRPVPGSFWRKAREIGMLCPTAPQEYGGPGSISATTRSSTRRWPMLASPPDSRSSRTSSRAISSVMAALPMKAQWLPRMVSGEVVTAIAMTEPGTGSDLQAIRTTARKDGNHYVVNGSKTYITNGQNADLTLVVAKTDPDAKPAWKGMSVILDDTAAFTKERKAFAGVVFDFQNTRFVLADLKARLQVGWAHLDWAIRRHLAGALTNEEGAAAKLCHTDLQWDVMDECLQLHGGAGYMNEYPIARAWRGARVSRIFGGTNEIMKEVIGRKL